MVDRRMHAVGWLRGVVLCVVVVVLVSDDRLNPWNGGLLFAEARLCDFTSSSLTQVPLGQTEHAVCHTLDFGKNPLRALPESAFSHFKGVEVLKLRGAQLEHIHPRAFAGLHMVHTLDLEDNKLTTLDEKVFEPLVNLTHLDLTNNSLSELPKGIFAFTPKLQGLLLGYNNFTKFPSAVHYRRYITAVDLSYNQVEKLGKNALGGMNMLQSLLLQHNSIRSIHSKVFRQRRRLRHLWLHNNQLTGLHSQLLSAEVALLEELSLSGNKLKKLSPFTFRYLHNLTYFDVHDNPWAANCTRWSEHMGESYCTSTARNPVQLPEDASLPPRPVETPASRRKRERERQHAAKQRAQRSWHSGSPEVPTEGVGHVRITPEGEEEFVFDTDEALRASLDPAALFDKVSEELFAEPPEEVFGELLEEGLLDDMGAYQTPEGRKKIKSQIRRKRKEVDERIAKRKKTKKKNKGGKSKAKTKEKGKTTQQQQQQAKRGEEGGKAKGGKEDELVITEEDWNELLQSAFQQQ